MGILWKEEISRRGQERIVRVKEKRSIPHMYIRRQHNETHEILKKGRRGEWKYNGGGKLAQNTLYTCMYSHNEVPWY
jgi:hypothetical protein